jgi:hypothetical protein
MINQTDDTSWQGKYLYYLDKGKLNVGALTNKFEIRNRKNNGLLGFVKWYPMWRKYCFVPLNCILDDGCLVEIAEFLKERTKKHMELKPRKTGVRISFIQQPLRFPKEVIEIIKEEENENTS